MENICLSMYCGLFLFKKGSDFMFSVFDINIKYELLNSMLGEYLENIIYSNNINIIIDIHDVLSKLFKMEIDVTDPALFIEEFTSNIISIISHYRRFFFNKGKYTTFYFLYNEKVPKPFVKIYPNYCSHFEEKYLSGNYKDYIKQGIKNFRNICEYIPHVKYINTEKFGPFVYMKEIIDNTSIYNLNIILSNNINYGALLNNHSIMINIRNDFSKVLTNDNIVRYLTNNQYSFSNELIPVLVSLIGSKKVSVDGITGIGKMKAGKIINNCIHSGELQNVAYFEPPFKFMKHPIIQENLTELEKKYFLFYPLELLFSNQNTIENEITSVELYATIEDFYQLNDVIFSHFSLNVQKLLAGELQTK